MKYDETLKPGDWVWNSKGGLLQIERISGGTFSAYNDNKGMYYTTLIYEEGQESYLYYTRRAFAHEIYGAYEIY